MTKRSINLIEFWLSVAMFSIPGMAFALSGFIRFKTGYFPEAEVNIYTHAAFTALVTFLWAFIVNTLGLNKLKVLLTLQTGIKTTAIATAYCMPLALSLAFLYRPSTTLARIFVLVGCSLIFVFSLAVIHAFRRVIQAIEKLPNGRAPIAILGADDFAQHIAIHLSNSRLARCRVACFVALPDQSIPTLNLPVLNWGHLDEVVDVFHCRELLVALPAERLAEAKGLFQVVQRLCIPARLVLDLGDGVFLPERIFDYCGIPLLDLRPYPIDTVGYALGKRLFDILFSLAVLLVTGLPMLLIALVIKITSQGPIFFSQERVSLNGRSFKMLKFRTMYVQDWSASNQQHTQRNDQRITAVGRILRRLSLDELPQFINVLKGDMSVVGPRPELTFFVQKFRQEIPTYMSRHNVKCGITGWAQVNGLRGSETSIPDRIQYDLYYLRNWSMVFDLKIIFMTVFSGVVGNQAY